VAGHCWCTWYVGCSFGVQCSRAVEPAGALGKSQPDWSVQVYSRVMILCVHRQLHWGGRGGRAWQLW
jgi:hypothetical protein